jgi:ATP-dependent Zn protease
MARKPPARKPPSQRNSGRPSAPHPTHDSYEDNPNHPHFVAVHEAAHAVAAVVLGVNLNSVDVRRRRLPDGRLSVGFTDTGPQDLSDTSESRESEGRCALIQAMVGGVAEAELNPKMWEHTGMEGDLADARRIAAMVFCEPVRRPDGRYEISSEQQARHQREINELIDSCNKSARNLVTSYWPEIVQVANELLERESLTGAEVEEIVRAGDEARSVGTA